MKVLPLLLLGLGTAFAFTEEIALATCDLLELVYGVDCKIKPLTEKQLMRLDLDEKDAETKLFAVHFSKVYPDEEVDKTAMKKDERSVKKLLKGALANKVRIEEFTARRRLAGCPVVHHAPVSAVHSTVHAVHSTCPVGFGGHAYACCG